MSDDLFRSSQFADAPGGNYVGKLARFIDQHPELQGRAVSINIRHDEWCAIYSGRACNCDPDVEVADGNDPNA